MILRNLIAGERRTESDLTHPRQPAQWLLDVIGTGGQVAGIDVTPTTALTYSAVYGAISMLAQDVAFLPLILYRKTGDSREPAHDVPLYRVLHDQSNTEQTAIIFRESMMAALLSRGNAYAEIELDQIGRPIGLWQIPSERVQVGHLGRNLVYLVDQKTPIPSERILHLLAFGDGTIGYSPLHLARQSIGVGLAAETNAASLYGNGSIPGGVLEVTKGLKAEAADRLRRDWEALHAGPHRGGRIAVLEDGTKYNPISVTPQDAQFLESRRFQVDEIARWYRLPPHKLGSMERATFSNIEQQGIDYVQFSLAHWLKRWEQEIARKLLVNTPDLYAEHKVDAFLRGDTPARYAAYQVARTGGWLAVNDIRKLENMDPVEGGDNYAAPLNSNTTGAAGATDVAATMATQPSADGAGAAPTAVTGQDVQVATAFVLNGAQITAATAIVTAVAAGQIPRDAGLGQLQVLFNLTSAQALQIMGSAGTSTPTTPNPQPTPKAPPPPNGSPGGTIQ